MDAAEYVKTAVTEAQWQQTVIEAAELLGWVAVHFPLMGRPDLALGNVAGYPDLTLFRGDQYVLAELKSQTGTVSPEQRRFHARIAAVGGVVHVWRPSDWEQVQEVLR